MEQGTGSSGDVPRSIERADHMVSIATIGVEDCPEWMVLVRSNCKDVFWLQQRTCDHPESALEGVTCGFSRCDCPEPMVLDTNSFNCYDADNCPTIIELDT
ncbi:hypothetical protein RR46_09918 [Papilio xuthus]|uniref:Uncharacterized protein n=1 Tax=Papilio xuthus TaxID=66420 RepID=A0A194QCK5_PAPXU|nr:hypothetical protein RR46_09918 [Papilio xuthus]